MSTEWTDTPLSNLAYLWNFKFSSYWPWSVGCRENGLNVFAFSLNAGLRDIFLAKVTVTFKLKLAEHVQNLIKLFCVVVRQLELDPPAVFEILIFFLFAFIMTCHLGVPVYIQSVVHCFYCFRINFQEDSLGCSSVCRAVCFTYYYFVHWYVYQLLRYIFK